MASSNCRSSNDNLVVGRGRIYFDQLIKGVYQGERYLGNTPDFSMSTSVDKLDHFSSDRGLRQKDKSINLETTRSLSLTTDNISVENVALFFAGKVLSALSTAQTDVKEKVNGGAKVMRGRQYQLGVTADMPMGQGAIKAGSFNIVYADAGTAISTGSGDISTLPGVTVLPPENYELDYTTGALWIEADAPDILGDVQLVVSYDRAASSREVVISSDDVVEGALRFVSDNPEGENMSYYFPKVSISPDGDYALKGDDWQQIGFTAEVLARDCNTLAVYAYRDTKVASTPLAISTDLPATKPVTAGQALTLNVVPTGGTPPYTYAWYFKAPGGSYVLVSGQTSATFNKANAAAGDSGSYKVEVRDATNAMVTSRECAVTVA